mmetsp:Transcript_43411/g.80886  ORF Transcript_43411/g.80886 Transcript_43411/m.80886 type:complete len:405 (+) Transcript_43411:93-1307(+)
MASVRISSALTGVEVHEFTLQELEELPQGRVVLHMVKALANRLACRTREVFLQTLEGTRVSPGGTSWDEVGRPNELHVVQGSDVELVQTWKRRLFRAANDGNLEEVEELLARAQHPNTIALQAAVRAPAGTAGEPHLEVVDSLLHAGANPLGFDPISGEMPLTFAARCAFPNRLEVLQRLLRAVNLNMLANWERGHAGYGLLHHAASEQDNVDAARVLLEFGLDANARTDDGWTPLHEAVRHGCLPMVEFLLHAAADVNCRDRHGRTPLHEAAHNNYKSIAEYLILHGADVNLRDNHGRTPPEEPGTFFGESLREMGRGHFQQKGMGRDAWPVVDKGVRTGRKKGKGRGAAQPRHEPAQVPAVPPKLHKTQYKTQLCRFHAQGHCARGEGCTFAHGARELRQRG